MINRTNTYFLLLSLSIFALIVKGISYALIGSYLPIILAVFVVMMFLLFRKQIKLLKFSISLWAISLILWSLLRIITGAINYFVKPLAEDHLHQQLGISGSIISVIFLGTGIYLLKKRQKNSYLENYA